MLYFVELLSLRVWLSAVLPALFRASQAGSARVRVLYVDQTGPGSLAARASKLFLRNISIEPLGFRLIDVRDESGLLVRLRLPYQDLHQFEDDLADEPEFRRFMEWTKDESVRAFVRKALTKASLSDRQSVSRALYLVQVFAWSARKSGEKHLTAFLEARPWFSSIVRYGTRAGLTLIPVPRTFTRRDLSLEKLPPFGFWLLRSLRDRLLHLRFGRSGTYVGGRPSPVPARLAFEYAGYFNLNRPECYSDFFFWQQSNLPGDRLLALFNQPADKIDDSRHKQLHDEGISAVALTSLATATPSVPLHIFRPKLQGRHHYTAAGRNGTESRWLNRQVESYWFQRQYWRDLFFRENVRLFTTWFRYDGAHCAIGDAIRSLGGIMTVYQRACQLDASAEVAIESDVAFGYSPLDAEVDRRSGSNVQYHVAVGYFGDHRFPLLREQAAKIRQGLERNGARFVVAFFDENSTPDERWHTGPRFQSESYEFLLEKILADASLGLVLKPKVPSSLKKRLGPVAALLDRAIATGRCFLYEEGVVQGVSPPAAAALSADLAIHGHLCAATAGLEAALAGTPTLLLDREGWRISDMYELGVGRVVFESWPEVWDAVLSAQRYGLKNGLGDWRPMLERLDPFRDGRGAERLGAYLGWLLEGLNNGIERKIVMADAAERYCRLWGHDKVRSVTGMVAKEIVV